MGFLMFSAITAVVEAGMTVLADVRLLAGMYTQVPLQVTGAAKRLLTLITHMLPLAVGASKGRC